MVLSSNQEGGANVVSEAIAADVPIIASNIGEYRLLSHNILGFPVRNESTLNFAAKAETDPKFLTQLNQNIKTKTKIYSGARRTSMGQADRKFS